MLTESCVMFFSPSRAVLSAILRDEYLTSAVRTKEGDKAGSNQPPARDPVQFKLELMPNYLISYLSFFSSNRRGQIFISQNSAQHSTGRRKKTWHMTQLTFSSNVYWKICFKFCIMEQIIATVLFICISSINNKTSLLRFQSTTAPTNRGWSACGVRWNINAR